MRIAEIYKIFERALVSVNIPAEGLEVRYEGKNVHSLFYNGKLLGLYKDRYRALKTIDGAVYHTDSDSIKIIGEALKNLISE